MSNYARELRHVEKVIVELERAIVDAMGYVAAGKVALDKSPLWPRPAKDEAIKAFNIMQKALRSAELTRATSGRALANLPHYVGRTREHAAVERLDELLVRAQELTKRLGRATVGDPDVIARAYSML